ncbi:MAG TPA: hypothetical protein VLS89_01890, partial [Candidatus Nanopelagicales bacterium]|nr:hypothetical protein [Candidatus Nanopelagicales bacterium]
MRPLPRTFPLALSALLLPSAFVLASCASAPPLEPPPPLPPEAAPAAPDAAPQVAAPAAPTVVDRVEVPPAIRAAVDAADRSDADRALDAGRRPAETLAFFGIA